MAYSEKGGFSRVGHNQHDHLDQKTEDVPLPPTYQQATGTQNVDATFPRSFQVITHLKLLAAFYKLRESVTNNPTLFGIDDGWLHGHEADTDLLEARRLIGEKCWDLYVHRAVVRFEAWWTRLGQNISRPKITVSDLADLAPLQLGRKDQSWHAELPQDMLPPLDVLMVWHSFLLSPRRYLEDCLLQGKMHLWQSRFPWSVIEEALRTDTAGQVYHPGSAAESSFASIRLWSNAEDECERRFACPKCNTWTAMQACTTVARQLQLLASTSTRTATSHGSMRQAVAHAIESSRGWADASFSSVCTRCSLLITHEALCAAKFVRDIKTFEPASTYENSFRSFQLTHVLTKSPMPGMILHPQTGLPHSGTGIATSAFLKKPEFFPIPLAATISNVDHHGMTGYRINWQYDTPGVRRVLQNALNCVEQMKFATSSTQRRATGDQRRAVRRMMSYYNANPSIFTLDLTSAVHRQSKFVAKMQQIDWLHSPALTSTANRVVGKYARFMTLIASHPLDMAVPTLDIDLAWHTHQLTPSHYYSYTVARTGRFVDHDDKVSEYKLSDSFARTSQNYYRLYGEPYSECTCWYCEAMHASVVSLIAGRYLLPGQLKKYRRPEHAPGDHTTAHISTHNVVRVENPPPGYKQKISAHMSWLEQTYQRACDRAKKDGRPPPVRRHPLQTGPTGTRNNMVGKNGHHSSAPYVDPMGIGGAGRHGRAAYAAGAVGVMALGVGVVAISIMPDGGLQFDGGSPECIDYHGSGGCVGGTCGDGAAWGGHIGDDSRSSACGGGGGGGGCSTSGGCSSGDGGGGCGGCGGG